MKRLLDDWIETYMEYTFNSESPLLFRRWVATSLVASSLQRRVYLDWDKKVYPNLYVVLIGPPGRSRKGTAMGPGAQILIDSGVHVAADATTRQGLIRQLTKASESVIDTTRGTTTSHSSLTIYSEELTVFLGYKELQLMTDLCDWYDCKQKWSYDTKTEELKDFIQGVWVNMLGATTPETLQEAMPSHAIGSGLASRIIFVYEDRKEKPVIFPGKTEREKQLYEVLLAEYEQLMQFKGEFIMSEECKHECWAPWYVNHDQHALFNHPRLGGYASRRPTHLLKLCMILSASRRNCEMVIEPQDFIRALKLLEATEVRMPNTFKGVGANTLSNVVYKATAVLASRGEVSFQDLLQMFCDDADKLTLERIVQTMEALGACTRSHDKERGVILTYNKNYNKVEEGK